MQTNLILYRNGDFDVRQERFGKTDGFAVYATNGTAAVRVASIGYPGGRGFRRATQECNLRARKAANLAMGG